MSELRTPRGAWVDVGLAALARGGVEAVRVERLARELGVTKGGFYGHFSDRNDLLQHMLDRWETVLVDEPMALVDAGPGGARDRLRRLFALGGAVSPELMAIELAVRDWARREASVAERVARVDTRRIAYLRRFFREFCAAGPDTEARCLLTATFFISSRSILGQHDGLSRDEVIGAALELLLR